MRHVASLLIVSSLGGCSLIYNPSNIATQQDGAPDSPYDAPFDGDPTMISVTGVRPVAITEGQGANGSRKAVIVIEGTNFVMANTTVTIVPTAPITKTPMLTVDNAALQVSPTGAFIAVPVTVDVDQRMTGGLKAGDSIAVDITVTQNAAGAPLTKTLSGVLKIGGLDELTGPAAAMPGGAERLYSLVNLTGTITSSGTEPLVIRSTSSLTIDMFNVSGSLKAGGPGGGTGGDSGSTLGTNPTPGTGPAGGLPGAPGGMTSEVMVTTLGNPFRGSGGGGADGLVGGGDGGGGGGTIVLTASGNLKTGAGTSSGGNPTNQGGGGSGGIIVLRAGGDVTTGALSVVGGVAGVAAKQGLSGRLRYDAGGTATLAGSPAGYRGPQFIAPSLIVNTDKPMLQVVGTPQTMISYYITNAAGTTTLGPFTLTVPDAGPATVVNGTDTTDRLGEGLNRVCLVAGTAPLTSETRNCIDIAYIGKLP